MATRATARFELFRQIFDEEEKLREEQRRITERERKKGSRSGLGSILGAIVAALATGGGSAIATGLAGGIGSRLGSEVGERTVGGSSQIGGDFLFNQPQIREANFQQRQQDREFGAGQNVDALMKAVMAGFAAPDIKGLFGRGGAQTPIGNRAISAIQTGIPQFGRQPSAFSSSFGRTPQTLGGGRFPQGESDLLRLLSLIMRQ